MSLHTLKKDQLERLNKLQEEAAEVIQAVQKVIQHGWNDYDPTKERAVTNYQTLVKELGDLQWAIHMLQFNGDVNAVAAAAMDKNRRAPQWMYHNSGLPNYTGYDCPLGPLITRPVYQCNSCSKPTVYADGRCDKFCAGSSSGREG